MKSITLAFMALFVVSVLKSQDQNDTRIPLIGEPAPEFSSESTRGKITFPDDFYLKWKVLFSHPADFTPVCTTELLELADMQDDLEKMDTKIVVISTDGLDSHMEWIRSMESIDYKNHGTKKIGFPLVADKDLSVSKKYGMIHSYSSTTKDVRGVFIIDPQNKIRAMFFYPMTTGRNVDEIKRTLLALQESDKHNVLTPANWTPGSEVLIRAPKTTVDAEKLEAKHDPDLRKVTWYLWFKKED
jgi:peroxiredoxin 2/4